MAAQAVAAGDGEAMSRGASATRVTTRDALQTIETAETETTAQEGVGPGATTTTTIATDAAAHGALRTTGGGQGQGQGQGQATATESEARPAARRVVAANSLTHRTLRLRTLPPAAPLLLRR